MSAFHDPDIELSTEATAKALQDDTALVVDVREQYERDAGHVDGTTHIEVERLASKADTLPRDRPVIFQCRLGMRSAMAANAFRRAGYDAYSMTGGVQQWFDEGRPLVPDGAVVAPH